MKVADVMSLGVELVPADATVQEAALRMAEEDVGAVLVGTPEAVQGILTDRDIILRLVVDGRNPAEVRVREIMSSTLFTCRQDDGVEDAFRQMSERQVRRMPVLDESGQLIGIVTLSDLAKFEPDPGQKVEALRRIAEPHRNQTAASGDEA